MKCGFNVAWVGKCKSEKPCSVHKDLICSSCGNPATHECGETGQFVCGSNHCDDCEHAIAPDGTNGGVGFFSTIPQEMKKTWKSHVKKTEQKFKPYWLQ